MNTNDKREIDVVAKDVYGWWNKTYVYVTKTKVATWKAVTIIAFIGGIFTAIIWMVSLNIQTLSKAEAGKVSLWLTPVTETVSSGSSFTTSIYLNTNTQNIVVARAILKYDPQIFDYVSTNTTSSVFASGNTCIYNSKPCEIVEADETTGSISITLVKPTPGVNTLSGILAAVTFTALAQTTPTSNLSLDFTQGSYTDSDLILNDGNGTDALAAVAGATITVTVPDRTLPVVTGFSIPSTSSSLTVPVSTFTATDNIAVTGYKITESSSAPAAGDAGWLATAPTSYNFGTAGSKTLYAWAKDAAGNISNSASGSVTITLPVNTYTVGGTISGLSGTIVVQNGGNNITRTTDGSYAFSGLTSGTSYNITITNPTSQTCSFTNSNSTGTVGTSNITNININCANNVVAPIDVTCTSFTYNCGDCQSSGQMNCTVATSSPSGCTGGSPQTIQSCTYSKPSSHSGGSGGSSHKKKKKSSFAVSNSPSTVARGAVLVESGKGFTKNGLVRLYFLGSKTVVKTIRANASGKFSLAYRVPLNRTSGSYSWYAVDVTKNKKTKTISYKIK